MRGVCLFFPFLALLIAAPGVQGQTGQTASVETSTDFVVRDKHGHLVRDLRPGDLQLTEDGKPVKISSLNSGRAASGRRYFSLLLDGDKDQTRTFGLTALNELAKSSRSESARPQQGRTGENHRRRTPASAGL